MSAKSKHYFESNINNRTKGNNYFNYNFTEGLRSDNFPQEFFPIVSLFAEDCNYNLKSLYTDRGGRFFISGYRPGKNAAQNELMLRTGNNRLVVARVEFIHQRQGKMTELYKILKNIRKKYNLDPIVIESCISDASINWCQKNGFVPIGESFIEKD